MAPGLEQRRLRDHEPLHGEVAKRLGRTAGPNVVHNIRDSSKSGSAQFQPFRQSRIKVAVVARKKPLQVLLDLN